MTALCLLPFHFSAAESGRSAKPKAHTAMEEWVLANIDQATATVQPVVGREPPAMELLISMDVVDRGGLQAMPSNKRRRLEQTALEVQKQAPTTKMAGHVVWQVKLEEADMRHGGTWVDMCGMWAQKCEEVFQSTKEHTDEMWERMSDNSGDGGWPPRVKGEDCGEPGYIVVFSMRQILQVNTTSRTRRPVRRLETSWGEDGSITYATGVSPAAGAAVSWQAAETSMRD